VDQDAGLAKFKFVAFSLLLFVVAGFQSCQEIKYALSSSRTTARVTDIREERGRRMRRIGYRVAYRFTNAGKRVTGYTIVGSSDVGRYSKGTEVEVDYLEGELFSSRIVGTGSLFWPAVLLVGILALVGSVGALWIEASRKVAGMQRR
jgi:hypothetical protein